MSLHHTPETKRRAFDLLDRGIEQHVVAQRLGVTTDTIRKWRKRRAEILATAEQHTLDDEETR